MIFTMIGGGAHRLLATARSALKEGVFLKGGEIRLYDLNVKRAHDMALMIQKSPEYRQCPVPVRYELTLEQALEGADLVSITLLAGGSDVLAAETALSGAYGFYASDNISYTGAFLALRDAPIIMNIARQMEKLCPDAILLDFANPVAVVTAMVSQFTSIRCYGICAGFSNHAWDLPRILTGQDAHFPDIEADVAGVNHFSWIIRGTWRGESLFDLLDRRLAEVPEWWNEIRFTPEKTEPVKRAMLVGLKRVADIYRHRGALLFSTEADGYAHFYHEEDARGQARFALGADGQLTPEGAEVLKAQQAAGAQARKAADLEFEAFSNMPADDIPWNDPMHADLMLLDRADVTARILCGLAGVETARVAVSAVNRGAVSNMDDRLALEFTHLVDRDGFHPAQNLKVPAGVYGITASIAEHQTLLATACGTSNPKDLYRALLAYPVGADTKAARELWKALLTTSEKYIAPQLQGLRDYL